MEIKGILISTLVPFENHMANGGEKLLGNASSIKRRPDGRVYISGQMQRHVLFSAMNRINLLDKKKGSTFVSNGDGISNQIENDLRADMGGFMHPKEGTYGGRRTAPLSVTPAIAMQPSEVGRDLLVCLKIAKEGKDQALATREFSQYDLMHMNFFLDISELSMSKKYTYEGSFNIATDFVKHVSEEERMRRVNLFLEASKNMNDYANQARNAISGEPQEVLIVLDTVLSRKAIRYYTAGVQERKNILAELDKRGAKYFIGDDKSEYSVAQAYEDALKELANSTLYDPSNGSSPISFEDAFGKEASLEEAKDED